MRPSDQDTVVGEGEATEPGDVQEDVAVREGGPRLGPYTVLSRIGRGGMGTVFAAYDLQLDRKIAVKVLHRTDDARARARVVREAQALAKLSHPGVVSVFAAGEHEGRPYIAMEFIDGRDLRRWKEEADPDFATILETYLQAGRGLAAAHEAGLVHRDFKPANVMIDSRGRVKVLDFGLAQQSEGSTGSLPALSPGSIHGLKEADLAAPLTRTGRTVGTPAYMAPEQMMAVRSDARADQFAFCVVLWEALYGERPFAGNTIIEILSGVAAGEIRDPPRNPEAAWMEPHLRRGLASDPDARWPDLRSLLDVLAVGEPVRARRWMIPAAAAVVVGAGAVAVLPKDDACSDGAVRIAQVWDQDRGQQLRETFAETDRSYVARLAEATAEGLDGYAGAWAEAYADACVDTRDGDQSVALRDARYACLNRSKRGLRVLASALEQGDVQALENADEAIERLPFLSRCADLDYVTAALPPPATPELAAQVEAITAELEDVDRLLLMGEAKKAETSVEALAERVSSFDHAPTRAAVYRAAARVAIDAERGPASLRWAEAAYMEARDVDPATAIDIHIGLARAYTAEGLDRAALRELDVVEALVERHMPGDAEFWRRTHNTRGLLNQSMRRGEDARSHFERALELTKSSRGSDSASTAAAHLNLGGALVEVGEDADGLKHTSAALQIWTKAFGPDHPDVGRALHNLAIVQRRMGEFDAAHESFTRALRVLEAAYGPLSPNVLRSHLSRAIANFERGDLARAEREARDVLASVADTPEQHPEVRVSGHRILALIHLERDEYDLGREGYRRSIAIQEQLTGPNSLAVVDLKQGLAVIEASSGNAARALELHEDVLRVRRTLPSSGDAVLADAESNVGLMMAAVGDCRRALPLMVSGLEFWTPRVHPSGRESIWLTSQTLLAALCQDIEGEHDKARQFAQDVVDFKQEFRPETSNHVRALAHVILGESSGPQLQQAATAAAEQLERPGVMIIRRWLEVVAPNHPLPPVFED